MTCLKCGAPTVTARTASGKEITLDPLGTPREAQVLVIGGVAAFLSGPALGQARRSGLPLHTRHNIHCPNFWKRID